MSAEDLRNEHEMFIAEFEAERNHGRTFGRYHAGPMDERDESPSEYSTYGDDEARKHLDYGEHDGVMGGELGLMNKDRENAGNIYLAPHQRAPYATSAWPQQNSADVSELETKLMKMQMEKKLVPFIFYH